MALLVGELYALLFLEKKAFLRGLKEAEAAAAASGSSIGSSLMSIGKVAALGLAALVVGLGAVGAAALSASTDFQKGMANVQTLIGKGSAVDARILELGQDVQKMAIETGKGLSDLTRGLYDVIGTFTDTADSAKWLELAAKAGAAGLSSTHDAILLLSAVTKAYGDTSFEAAQKAADLIFQTANLGVTTFPEMAAAMQKVLPVAAALKVSQEELFGAMATLTGTTGDTSQVVTQLYSIMRAFLKPNTDMLKAIKETGYASGAAMIEELGMAGALKAIGATSIVAEKGVAKVFGRAEALTAVLALNGAQAADWVWKTDAMRKSAGMTARAFEIQQATAGAIISRIGAAFEVLAVSIGNKLMPAFTSFLKWVEKSLPDIAEIVMGAMDAMITGFGIVAGVIGWFVDRISTAWSIIGDIGMQGPIIQAVLVLIAAGFIALGIAAAGAAVGVIAATWPILAVIGLIALGIKGLSLIFEAFGISVDDVFSWVGATAKDFVQAFLSVLGSVVNVVSMLPGPLQDAANSVKKTLDQMHDDVGQWGVETAATGYMAADGVAARMADGFDGGASEVTNSAKSLGIEAGAAMAKGINESVKAGIPLTAEQLAFLGEDATGAFADGIDAGGDKVVESTMKLVDKFGTSMKAVKQAARVSGGEAMAEMAKGILDARSAPVSALSTLKSMLKDAMTPAKEAARLAGELISKTLAKGLHNGDPAVRAQAIATKKIIIDRLLQLVTDGAPLGKKAMTFLAKAMKSKDKDISAAAKHVVKVAKDNLNPIKKKAWDIGWAAGKNLAKALRSAIAAAIVAANIVVKWAITQFKDKGYATGSWKIPRNEMAFLHAGEMVIPAAAAQRLRESATTPTYSGRSGSGGGQGGPMIGHLSVTVNPGPNTSRGEARRFGQNVLDVVASGLREQTARTA